MWTAYEYEQPVRQRWREGLTYEFRLVSQTQVGKSELTGYY